MSDPNSPLPPRTFAFWIKVALGVVCLVSLAAALMVLFNVAMNTVTNMQRIDGTTAASGLLIGSLILYAALIALPFMPGIEVGVAILMIQGPQSAPLVYIATVTGLITAYLVGRLVPLSVLQSVFARLRLRRAAQLVESIRSIPPDARLAQQRALLPKWLARITVDYRYIAIGVLLNVPGTFAIGGGGGILLAAGLSRLFNGWLILVTLMIATLPVPLTVWVMGTQVFQ